MINAKLNVRLDGRWPQGIVGRRDTRIIKNAHIFLATADERVTKIGWGDICLEQWHTLREITAEGLGLVASETVPRSLRHAHHQAEAAGAAFEDIIPTLVLGLDHSSTLLLNHLDPYQHTLGVVSLPGLDRQETRRWLAERLAELAGSE